MSLDYTVRPISDRTAFSGPPFSGDRNPFRRSTWGSTLEILERELRNLDASRVVLELDVRERDIRVDGRLRSDARTDTSPAVRVAFDTPVGPMQFATDRYGWTHSDRPYADGWQQNVRAIALGLEALRKVDRYGITRRREQYQGFRALPAGAGVAPSGMTTDLAIEIIAREAGHAGNVLWPNEIAGAVRAARSAAHPDRHNGDRSRYDAVDEAVQVLTRAGKIGSSS